MRLASFSVRRVCVCALPAFERDVLAVARGCEMLGGWRGGTFFNGFGFVRFALRRGRVYGAFFGHFGRWSGRRLCCERGWGMSCDKMLKRACSAVISLFWAHRVGCQDICHIPST